MESTGNCSRKSRVVFCKAEFGGAKFGEPINQCVRKLKKAIGLLLLFNLKQFFTLHGIRESKLLKNCK
jgi:hypothetical protein